MGGAVSSQRHIAGAALRSACLMAALLSSGCAAPAVVAAVALDGLARGAMRHQLSQAMRGYGLASPAAAPAGAQWRVAVLEFSEDRRVLRISPRAREAEVALRGRLRVRIERPDAEDGEQHIIRQYRAERRQVLLRPDSDATQEWQLRSELRAELAARAAADVRWVVTDRRPLTP